MDTNESCRCCEKIVMTVESFRPFNEITELPNTFDRTLHHCGWQHHTMMTYAIVPQSFSGTKGVVDLYICLDEDDLDDIDLRELAREFLNRANIPGMKGVKEFELAAPLLAEPSAVGCWKMKHVALEEEA